MDIPGKELLLAFDDLARCRTDSSAYTTECVELLLQSAPLNAAVAAAAASLLLCLLLQAKDS
jgi:hypothetical protein